MMRWISIGLFMLVSIFFVLFGLLYSNVNDLLWFHAAAVPHEALTAVRPLYFALMKLVGGAAIAIGFVGAYLTLGPIRSGRTPAAWALSVTFAIPLVMAAYVAETLAATTGAPTAWYNMGILLAITATALGLHHWSRRA